MANPSPLVPSPMAAQGPQTYRERLDAAEQHWRWKTGLRVLLIIAALVGIGCIAWAVQTGPSWSYTDYSYDLDDYWWSQWSLITFSLSVLWCAIVVLVLLCGRPPSPVHPGAAVGVDLVLWLGYIVTITFAMIGTLDYYSSGYYSTGSISSDNGYYTQAANGTWIFKFSYSSSDTRDCDNGQGYFNGRTFTSCAAEDAYANTLLNGLSHARNNRRNVEIAGVVCQFIALVLHFTLFVWACVDTARYNRKGASKDAEKLAAEIVMNMVRSGAIIPNPQAVPAAYMPPGNYPQYPNHQQYSQYGQPQQMGLSMQQMGQMAPPMAQPVPTARPVNNTTEYYQPHMNEKQQLVQQPMMSPHAFQQAPGPSNRPMIAPRTLPTLPAEDSPIPPRPEPPAKSAARNSTGPNSPSISPAESSTVSEKPKEPST